MSFPQTLRSFTFVFQQSICFFDCKALPYPVCIRYPPDSHCPLIRVTFLKANILCQTQRRYGGIRISIRTSSQTVARIPLHKPTLLPKEPAKRNLAVIVLASYLPVTPLHSSEGSLTLHPWTRICLTVRHSFRCSLHTFL